MQVYYLKYVVYINAEFFGFCFESLYSRWSTGLSQRVLDSISCYRYLQLSCFLLTRSRTYSPPSWIHLCLPFLSFFLSFCSIKIVNSKCLMLNLCRICLLYIGIYYIVWTYLALNDEYMTFHNFTRMCISWMKSNKGTMDTNFIKIKHLVFSRGLLLNMNVEF